MFSHLMLGTNDLAASHRFYDAVLGALGAPAGQLLTIGGLERVIWKHQGMSLIVAAPRDGQAATVANGFTLGCAAASPEAVMAAYEAALAHGGIAIEDPPGWREKPGMRMYLAYVRDPAGHKLCLGHRA